VSSQAKSSLKAIYYQKTHTEKMFKAVSSSALHQSRPSLTSEFLTKLKGQFRTDNITSNDTVRNKVNLLYCDQSIVFFKIFSNTLQDVDEKDVGQRKFAKKNL